MSHTPGPWRYMSICDENGEDDGGVLIGEHIVVADYLHLNNLANARLIAAAPELYEELREILDYAREVYAQFGGDDEKRGRAPRIREDIVRVEALLKRLDGEDEDA